LECVWRGRKKRKKKRLLILPRKTEKGGGPYRGEREKKRNSVRREWKGKEKNAAKNIGPKNPHRSKRKSPWFSSLRKRRGKKKKKNILPKGGPLPFSFRTMTLEQLQQEALREKKPSHNPDEDSENQMPIGTKVKNPDKEKKTTPIKRKGRQRPSYIDPAHATKRKKGRKTEFDKRGTICHTCPQKEKEKATTST